jgi:molybdenum cofactor guanylyltransferase
VRQQKPCPPEVEAEGFVLAGGRSSRMGRDKAMLRLSGRTLVGQFFPGGTLLDLALDKLRALKLAPAGTPRIAGSRPDLSSQAPVVEDLHPGCGPLSGIEAALAASTRSLNLFLPVDLPLLPAEFLSWMLQRASITGAMVTFPRIQGRPQPLCAVYRRELLPSITQSLLDGDYKVTRVVETALGNIGIPRIQAADIFDLELLIATYPELHAASRIPWQRWFQNCNSPEDLETLNGICQPG